MFFSKLPWLLFSARLDWLQFGWCHWQLSAFLTCQWSRISAEIRALRYRINRLLMSVVQWVQMSFTMAVMLVAPKLPVLHKFLPWRICLLTNCASVKCKQLSLLSPRFASRKYEEHSVPELYPRFTSIGAFTGSGGVLCRTTSCFFCAFPIWTDFYF